MNFAYCKNYIAENLIKKQEKEVVFDQIKLYGSIVPINYMFDISATISPNHQKTAQ